LSGGVIAIDGPAASGKSSTARAVAEALGFAHLDSGSLYRGVTLVALREAVRQGVQTGDLTHIEIRSAEVTAQVSAISAIPVVREWINSRLRALVRAGQDVVVDGRDIGTVVFPDADLKIFLTASPQARAGRRISQRGMPVQPEGLDAEAAVLAARDHADSTRAVAPLRPAKDAVHLDTTTMNFAEQVRFIVDRARPIFSRP
jgi:cytidylate kinase